VRPFAVRVSACVAIVGLLAFTSACSNASGEQELVVTGSTTILPIAEVAAERYAKVEPGAHVLVSGVGSSSGIDNVANGSSDIGTSSRELKEAEENLGLVDHPIAYDAIAVIVNLDNPVRSLSHAQVKAMFAGEITNWSELGGSDLPIGLVNRDEASGTREAFSKIIMDGERFDSGAVILPGTGQVRSVVADAPGAVGYISLGFVTSDVRAIAIDGVEPTEESVVVGDYPVQRVLHAFTKGEATGLVARYIDFLLSPAIQDTIVRDAGFIPISAKKGASGG
jgi:phosphate transport system substrate-binding protein